jgi:hypothetical protein
MLTDKARKIADEAKSKGMWLYDPSYKKWYSPRTSNISFILTMQVTSFLKKLHYGIPLKHTAGCRFSSEHLSMICSVLPVAAP